MIVRIGAEVAHVHVVFTLVHGHFAAPAVVFPQFHGLGTGDFVLGPAEGELVGLVRPAVSGAGLAELLVLDMGLGVVPFRILHLLQERLHELVGNQQFGAVLQFGRGIGIRVVRGSRILRSPALSLLLVVVVVDDVLLRLLAVSEKREDQQQGKQFSHLHSYHAFI